MATIMPPPPPAPIYHWSVYVDELGDVVEYNLEMTQPQAFDAFKSAGPDYLGWPELVVPRDKFLALARKGLAKPEEEMWILGGGDPAEIQKLQEETD